MSDEEKSTPESEDPNAISPKQKFREKESPAAGCLILGTIVTVFGILIILYLVVGFYQNSQHHKFTDENAREIQVLEPTAEQTEHATRLLKKLERSAIGNTSERFKFTATDLNTIIATRKKAEGFRGNTFIRKITDQGIEVEMTHPVKQMGFGKPNRYLNAIFVFEPQARPTTLAFKVVDIRKEDRDVEFPKVFIESYAALDFFRLDDEDELMKPVLAKIRKAYTEGEFLVIETKVKIFK